jgi:hypothetical protein
MSFAALSVGIEKNAELCYLTSEKNKSVLHIYSVENGDIHEINLPKSLDDILDLQDYLNAHLPNFDITGFHKENNEQLSAGGKFEKAIHDCLKKNEYEVIAGIKPAAVGGQIDIDLAIRWKNNVAIAEVKLAGGEAPKKALDQLAQAGEQQYLGTYTKRIYIGAKRLPNNDLRELAREKEIHVIEIPGYSGKEYLEREEEKLLLQRIKEILH